MNERIKALAEQAGMEPEDGAIWWVGDGDLEKFADLIVKKCAELAEECYCGDTVKSLIMNHFGLEP
jgi:hypothetical protein